MSVSSPVPPEQIDRLVTIAYRCPTCGCMTEDDQPMTGWSQAISVAKTVGMTLSAITVAVLSTIGAIVLMISGINAWS